jgi:hypothetical protein
MKVFRFAAPIARRLPDPLFREKYGMERHILVVPVRSMPPDLPLEPNARRPNVRRRVYSHIENSLLNRGTEPGTFHLKNKGITVIARSVDVEKRKNSYVVRMDDGHGIVDGGHTYELIQQNLKSGDLPEDQFVTVEVRVGLPDEWIPDIAQGLNTSVQVQDMSLDNLRGLFDWLRDELKDESYADRIAWSENDDGDFDARDIVSLLMAFNVELFPNDKGDEHPVAAYEKKSAALRSFEQNQASYKKMRGLVRDILRLYDIIGKEGPELWNVLTGGKAGQLAWVDHRKGKAPHEFIFEGAEGDKRLFEGALYPMVAAYRWYVEVDKKGNKMKWRGSFADVIKSFRKTDARELLSSTRQMSDQMGRNPNAIGKSRSHWATLHTIVVKNDLMRRTRTKMA